MGKTPVICLICLACAAKAQNNCTNNHPIVGFLTQPDGSNTTKSYFSASYVKFAEAAGTQVVPVPHDMPTEKLDALLNQINGVIIPGGAQPLREGQSYHDTVVRLLQYATDAGDKGIDWPLWGVCLGFEALSLAMANNNHSILQPFDAKNMSTTVQIPSNVSSVLLQGLPPDVLQNMQQQDILFSNHQNGISQQCIEANPTLCVFINVVGYSNDRKNKAYVAMWEAKKYPIYAVQFHPEKNAYEWAPFLDVSHSSNAIAMMAAFAQFFGNQTRCNDNAPLNASDMDSRLIYKYCPTYTGKGWTSGGQSVSVQKHYFPPYKA